MAALCLLLLSVSLTGCGFGQTPFPEVDRSKLTISLERTACFGNCPDYLVTIHGDGRVVFTTADRAPDPVAGLHREFSFNDGVLVSGVHLDRIDPAAVDDLIRQFREAEFFDLKDKYSADITDLPSYILEIDTGNGRKRVVDYAGEEAGMPHAVTLLQDAVDRAAGTDRWIRGADGLVSWLKETGFDMQSPEAARIAVDGVESADEATLLGLIDAGAPLEAMIGSPVERARPAGLLLTRGALRHGRPLVLRRLASAGWLERLDDGEAARLFADGAAGCSPEFVDAVAVLGISIDAPGTIETSDYERPRGGKTALAALSRTYACKENGAARVGAARALLARGADPNSRDVEGETPIFGADPAMLDLLLSNGADPAARDISGNSAVFSTWEDEEVVRLLEAGASPVGSYFDGRTLEQQAVAREMHGVLRWLRNHPRAPALLEGTGPSRP